MNITYFNVLLKAKMIREDFMEEVRQYRYLEMCMIWIGQAKVLEFCRCMSRRESAPFPNEPALFVPFSCLQASAMSAVRRRREQRRARKGSAGAHACIFLEAVASSASRLEAEF